MLWRKEREEREQFKVSMTLLFAMPLSEHEPGEIRRWEMQTFPYFTLFPFLEIILVFMMISKIGCLKKQTNYFIWCSNKAAPIQLSVDIGLSERLWMGIQGTWKEILTLQMVKGDLYFITREQHAWRSWNDKEHGPLR